MTVVSSSSDTSTSSDTYEWDGEREYREQILKASYDKHTIIGYGFNGILDRCGLLTDFQRYERDFNKVYSEGSEDRKRLVDKVGIAVKSQRESEESGQLIDIEDEKRCDTRVYWVEYLATRLNDVSFIAILLRVLISTH